MPLDTAPFEKLGLKDLRNLLDAGVREGKTIEYKSNPPAKTDSEKKKLLIQVSSFANAVGGHLIYGVRETKGVPEEISGFEIIDPDAETQRLHNIIRDGIEPRIWGIDIKTVAVSEKMWGVIIRIPRSFNPPHMVTIGGERRFYSRGPAGKYPLDVGELRTLFGLSDTIARNAREFRFKRISRIIGGETPVPLQDGLKIVLHLIPLAAFDVNKNYDLSSFATNPTILPNIACKVHDGRYNLDGFVSCNGYIRQQNQNGTLSYTQVFRNGIIEAVHMQHDPNQDEKSGKTLPINYEQLLVQATNQFLTLQGKMGASAPIFVMLSILDAKGCMFSRGRDPSAIELSSFPLEQENIVLPEVMLESLDCDLSEHLRYVFDIVRNAAGLEPKE